MMDKEDIAKISTKHVNGIDVPISIASIKVLNHFKQFIWENMTNNVSGAMLPSTYIETCLLTYLNGVNLKKKNNVSYNVTTSGLPAFTGPATSNKSVGEKRYEAWTRKTPDKTKIG